MKIVIKYRLLAPLILGLLVLGAAYWGLRRDGSSPPGIEKRATDLAESLELQPSAAPSEALRYGYQVGDALDYRFEASHDISMRVSDLFIKRMNEQGLQVKPAAVPEEPSRLTTSGTLRLEVYEGGASLALGWRLVDASVQAQSAALKGAGDGEQESAYRKHLGREFLVVMTPRGEVTEFWFPKDLLPEAEFLLRHLVLLTRFVFPDAALREWALKEKDSTGNYTAQYRMEPMVSKTSDHLYARMGRQKGEYLELFGASASDQKVASQGETTGILDRTAGYFQTITGSDLVRVTGIEFVQDISVGCKGSFTLEKASRGNLDEAQGAARAAALRAQGRRSGIYDPDSIARYHRGQERKEVLRSAKGLSLKNELAKLTEALSAPKPSSEAASKSWQNIVKVLQGSGSACHELAHLILEPQTDRTLALALVDALGAAGTPTGDRALIEVLKESSQADIKEQSIMNLANARTNLEAVAEALRPFASGSLEDPLTSTSILALGSLTRTLSEVDAAQARALGNFLCDALAQTPTPQGRTLYLEALGNTGLSEALPTLEPYLRDSHEDLRAAATAGLRLVKEDRVDALLSERFLSDPSSAVKLQAAKALVLRNSPQAFDLLSRTIQDPTSADLRRVAIHYLGQQGTAREQARPLLEVAAMTDPSADLRKIAGRYLKTLGKPR